MKVFGRYLVYRLKKSALRTLIFTLLSLLLTQTATVSGISGFYPEYHNVGLHMHAVVLSIFCTLIPMLETEAFKNRRNLDTLYFFPIERKKMALVHYISGLLQILVIYSIPFFTAWIYLEAQTNYFALGYMLPYYFLSLLLGVVMYSFFIFVFGQANTVVDGGLFCILWIVAPYLVASAILNLDAFDEMSWRLKSIIQEWGFTYASINNLTVIFQELIEVNKQVHEGGFVASYATYYRQMWYVFLIWGAVSVASAVGYFTTFVNKGAEKAGEISDSIFGYKLLIPMCGYSLMVLIGTVDVITAFMVLALMVIGYIIYRRSFRFKISDYILTGGALLMVFLGDIL